MSETTINNLLTKDNKSIDERVNNEGIDEHSEILLQSSATTSQQASSYIVPHLMGHDLNNVSDDINISGKRISKPRPGVKVPYRNLTSQIVTQDEIAKEILERSLKKLPYENFKSNELFNSMKLTSSISNRVHSGTAATTSNQTVMPGSLQNEEETRIKDNKELLSILNDSPESTNTISPVVSSTGKKNNKQDSKITPTSIYKFIKMYPELEKELALKQLEEFTKPRKKKEEDDSDSKPVEKSKVLQKRVRKVKGTETNNNVEKRLGKRPKGLPGIVTNRILKGSVVGDVNKERIVRKRRIIPPNESPKKKKVLKNGSNGEIPHTATTSTATVISTVADISQITEMPFVEDGTLPIVPAVKDNRYIKKYINKKLASRSDEDVDCSENASTLNGSLTTEYDFDSNDNDYKNVENLSPKIKKTGFDKKSDVLVNSSNKQKQSNVEVDNLNSSDKKKQSRVMREIDRLLGDEGAINMLYSVEQKRTPGNTPNRRGMLPSTRRKKKDLLLKTRLVKNAVLRLSNSPPQSLGKTLLRARRESSVTTDTNTPNSEPPQRKMSVESRESLQSPIHSPSFAFPEKLSVPAEASRIIRRHSSSSSYSSRSNSPRRPSIDADRSPFLPHSTPSPEKIISDLDAGIINAIRGHSHSPSRKHEGLSDKAKHMLLMINDRKSPVELCDRSEYLSDMKYKEFIDNQKIIMNIESKGDVDSLVFKKDIRNLVKNKILSPEFSRAIKKDLVASKLCKSKKTHLSDVNVAELQQHFLKAPSKHDSLTASSSSFHAAAASSSTKEPSVASISKKGEPSSTPLNTANYLKDILGESHKKKDGEEKQRSSVRQNAGAYAYKEINLRRYDHLVQIIFTPISTRMKNAFNLQVLKEVTSALNCLKKDDGCRVVLFTSTGSAFCHGIDLTSLIHPTPEKRKAAALDLVIALKDFIKSLATFNKPLIAGVHGAAVGLGVTMLPFFDMVFASDKATFHTPYARLGQIPEGAATLTLPQMLGNAVTSELLFGCRKLTASEALHFGLVTRILWPDRFQEELIPLIRGIATQSSQSMEATKALLRSSLCSKLDSALLSESQILLKHWMSNECQRCFKQYLEEETPTLQK